MSMAAQSTCPCVTWSRERMCLETTSIIISAHKLQMRGPPMRGNSVVIWWAMAFFKVLALSGPNFLRRKSVWLFMGGPPASDFFFAAA